MANTYFDMLQAVENYYGSGSDQWMTMANWTGYQSVEVANILKQTPGVSVYTNAAGEIMSYSVNGAASSMTAAEATAATAANAINSNALTQAAVQESVVIPANVTAGATSGTVNISSGATKLAAGGGRAATVMGHVGTGIVGAAVGMKLGVWIDGALYNANPDFWDSHNLSELNPETWNQTKITGWLYDYSGYDDFIAHFDEDGQMYIDENVFALYAQYLASRGAYDVEHKSVITPEVTSALRKPDYTGYPSPMFYTKNYLLGHREYQGQQMDQEMLCTGDVNCYFVKTSTYFAFGADSTSPFTVQFTQNHGTPQTYNVNTLSSYYEKPLYHFEIVAGTTSVGAGMPFYIPTGSVGADYQVSDFGYISIYGRDESTGGVPGINPYDVTPTGITPQMPIADVIDALKQQYPQIWDEGIKQGTLNEDGTITDHIYVPVAVPTGGTAKQPTSDPEHPGAVDPTNEPQTKIAENVLKSTPQPSPTNPTPTDTGTGSTPAVPAPTGSADALYKIYNPTNAQIQAFGAWLWSSNFVDQILKLFNDPMQAIISLHKIYATPHIGGTSNIKVGYLDSGVSSNYVDQQYIDVDCGSVNLLEKWGSVLDYEPFVDVRIYLPFIGIVSLSTADVMRAKISVKYRIDVITGTLVASVSVQRDSGSGGVIYQYTGSCCESYPLSSGSYMGILTGVLGIAAGVAGTIATGGAAAPALLGGAAGLSAMHTKIEHSNGFSGNAGAMACKKPYLIISKQQSAMSDGIGRNGGYPTNSYVNLYQCSGLTKVKFIHLESIRNATDFEHDEIIRLLTEGVII